MNRSVPLGDLDLINYHQQGYLILREAFTSERIQALLDAVNRLIDRALSGNPELRWMDRENRLPARTGHLLHPEKYDPAFAEWLNDDLAPQIEALLSDCPARHSLFGMLASGGGQPYCQKWHRDIGKPGVPGEADFLKRFHGKFVQFNAPLLAGDRFLNIVPASHLRDSTPEEIRASADGDQADMPGALIVELEPGDIVYYNANLWHRGWNPEGINRWTLHCAFWQSKYPVMKHEHGQREAFLTPGYLDQLPPMTRKYIERYLDRYPEGEPKTLLEL
ncbi:MAG: phytanoyl-CoA dioxygenase family protein [bacterium]|nr:phytanoyl-CoA dioxygenase family protein [bacterium]